MTPGAALARDVSALSASQAGTVARWQVLASGRTDDWIQAHLDGRRWQRVHDGVYAVFTGPRPRVTELWAALLACGRGATLSHETALEVEGVVESSPLIHVSVPADRRVVAPAGVRVHYSPRLATSRHPLRRPPRTRVEEAVVDMIAAAESPTEVIDLIARACQRRRTTAAHLLRVVEDRRKLRWRALTVDVLSDVAEGAETPLERLYLREVERRHGLPPGERQRGDRFALRTRWRDVRYERYGLVVELDGAASRPQETAFRDYERDNVAAERAETAVRYGWRDVAGRTCGVAAQVARLLHARGWTGRPRPCGASCSVGALDRAALP